MDIDAMSVDVRGRRTRFRSECLFDDPEKLNVRLLDPLDPPEVQRAVSFAEVSDTTLSVSDAAQFENIIACLKAENVQLRRSIATTVKANRKLREERSAWTENARVANDLRRDNAVYRDAVSKLHGEVDRLRKNQWRYEPKSDVRLQEERDGAHEAYLKVSEQNAILLNHVQRYQRMLEEMHRQVATLLAEKDTTHGH